MSRAAQEVARQVEEMRRKRPQNRRPRVEHSDQSGSPTDVTDELAPSQPAETSTTQGEPVAKSRRAATARKRTAKPSRKAKSAKRTRPASKPNGKWSGEGVPDPSTMRLARGGVAAGDGNTIRLTFSNGYGVGMKVSDVVARDNLVNWLRKRLGADRS